MLGDLSNCFTIPCAMIFACDSVGTDGAACSATVLFDVLEVDESSDDPIMKRKNIPPIIPRVQYSFRFLSLAFRSSF